MLNRLFSTIKRGSRKIGEGGYTLIEVAAVVAITATLAAVVIPVAMDKIAAGRTTGALEDCKYIGTAIASFYRDTEAWPARRGATADYYTVLRSGESDSTDPADVTTKWALLTTSDLLHNHLVIDNPGGTPAYLANYVYWRGPYIEKIENKTDPWGKNYVVWVKGMHTGGTQAYPEFGWIISAGPNRRLDTKPTNSDLQGDDIGMMLYSEPH